MRAPVFLLDPDPCVSASMVPRGYCELVYKAGCKILSRLKRMYETASSVPSLTPFYDTFEPWLGCEKYLFRYVEALQRPTFDTFHQVYTSFLQALPNSDIVPNWMKNQTVVEGQRILAQRFDDLYRLDVKIGRTYNYTGRIGTGGRDYPLRTFLIRNHTYAEPNPLVMSYATITQIGHHCYSDAYSFLRRNGYRRTEWYQSPQRRWSSSNGELALRQRRNLSREAQGQLIHETRRRIRLGVSA